MADFQLSARMPRTALIVRPRQDRVQVNTCEIFTLGYEDVGARRWWVNIQRAAAPMVSGRLKIQ